MAEAGALLLADCGDISCDRADGVRRAVLVGALGLGLVLLAWRAARRITSRSDVAWLAGAITATCYGYFAMARAALPDLPLTFFITLGIWTALERRWALAGAGRGSRVPDEGTGGAGDSGPRAAANLVARGDAIVRCAYATSACAAAGLRGRRPSVVCGDVDRARRPRISRAFSSPTTSSVLRPTASTSRARSGSMFRSSSAACCHGLRFWWCLPARSLRRRLTRARRLTNDEWRLILWAFVPLIFYTISVGKQPRYILPVLPPLAILLARSIATRIVTATSVLPLPARSWLPASAGQSASDLRLATWITAALYLVLAVLLVRARPLFITAYPVRDMDSRSSRSLAAARSRSRGSPPPRALTRLPVAHDVLRRRPAARRPVRCAGRPSSRSRRRDGHPRAQPQAVPASLSARTRYSCGTWSSTHGSSRWSSSTRAARSIS